MHWNWNAAWFVLALIAFASLSSSLCDVVRELRSLRADLKRRMPDS